MVPVQATVTRFDRSLSPQLNYTDVHHLEARVHGLVVGDALGVVAAHYSHNGVRQRHIAFLGHLEVAYHVYAGVGGDNCYAVQGLFGKLHIGHLDDSFGAQMLALEIVAYCHMVGHILYAQNSHSFEKVAAGNAVNHGAVAQCGHGEFFLLVCHCCWFSCLRISIPSERQMMAWRAKSPLRAWSK